MGENKALWLEFTRMRFIGSCLLCPPSTPQQASKPARQSQTVIHKLTHTHTNTQRLTRSAEVKVIRWDEEDHNHGDHSKANYLLSAANGWNDG